MGNKCWNCIRLSKCLDAYRAKNMETCTKFIKYIDKVQLNQVAAMCGIAQSTLSRWLLKDPEVALVKIKNLCGFEFSWERVNSYSIFELALPNIENCIKLTKKLKEMKNDIK